MSDKTNINNIITLFFSTASLIKEKMKEQGKLASLPMSSVRTLRYISEKGEPTMKGLADHLFITPPSATSLIEHDVKIGLIKRLVDKNDRRIVRLAITPKGKKALADSYKCLNKVMVNILKNLNSKQINEFKSILETLSRIYEK